MINLKNPPRITGTFYSYSLTCDCEVDRVIEDHRRDFFCGVCLEPMEKVPSKDLPLYDQEDILLKLRAQATAAAEAKAEAARQRRDEEDL